MKQNKQCIKCDSLQVAVIAYQPESLDGNETQKSHNDVTALHVGVQTLPAVFGANKVLIGKLEAYVCTDCGYYESYVRDPENVPWERIDLLQMLNPPPQGKGPFR